MTYILQKAPDISGPKDGYSPTFFSTLPDDIPTLAEGDWKWSEKLLGWVGIDSPRNQAIYNKRINAA